MFGLHMWTSYKVHHSQTYVDSNVLYTYSCGRLLWTNSALADNCGQIPLWQITVNKYSCGRLLWTNWALADNCGQIPLWQITVNKYSCGGLLWTNTVVADYCGQIQMWQTTVDKFSFGRQLWTNTAVADYCQQIQLWRTTVDKYSRGTLLWTIVTAHSSPDWRVTLFTTLFHATQRYVPPEHFLLHSHTTAVTPGNDNTKVSISKM